MLDAETVRRLLDYDPATGIFTWKPRNVRNWDRRFAGKQAGRPGQDRRYLITVFGRARLSHRLAWLYVHGTWPDQLDHINRDPADNRIANLRLATTSQNHANMPKASCNTSGFKGVSWSKQRQKWIANIKINQKLRNLGGFNTPEAAHEAYKRAATEAFGEFAYMGFLTRGP